MVFIFFFKEMLWHGIDSIVMRCDETFRKESPFIAFQFDRHTWPHRIETLGCRLSIKSIESKPWINGGCFIQRDFRHLWGNPFPRAKKLRNGHFDEKTSNKNCRTIFSEF